MPTNQLQWTRSGRELSDYLLGRRSKPVAVVSVLPGAPALGIDADYIASTVADDGEVIVITNGKTTYELRDGMPHGTSLFGSAARVYSQDLDWVTHPNSSPLRVAHGSADARYIAEQIINDVLNKIPDPATFAAPALRAPAAREGTIEAILAGGTRAVARLQDGTQALIRQEDTLPGIPLDWLYTPGQPVSGTFVESTGSLDVSGTLTIPRTAQAYPWNGVIWCLVQKVSAEEATLAIFPRDTVTVRREDISSNPLDRVDTLLTEGDVVAARLCLDKGIRRLRLADIDDGDPVCTAPALTPAGQPWLLPGRTLIEAHTLSPATLLLPATVHAPVPGRPRAAVRPAQSSTGSKALRDTQLQLENARRQIVALKETTATLAATQVTLDQLRKALSATTTEAAGLRHQLSASTRTIRSQQERLKTARTRARSIDRHTRQTVEETPLFPEREEQLRHDIYMAWAHRIPADDKPSFPLRSYTLGTRFAESFDAHSRGIRAKALKALVDLLTGRARNMPARDIHVLRTGHCSTEPALTRIVDGAVCWRMAVEKGTAAARRIHYWEIPGGGVELHELVPHETTDT